MLEFDAVLKTAPPRLPESSLKRERLTQRWKDLADRSAVAAIAPAGFGKTTLLLQWRQLWSNRNASVAWLGADAEDDPARFTSILLHALAHAHAPDSAPFDSLATMYGSRPGQEIEAMTGALAEIARSDSETVLVIDDAERLPEATHELVQYLFLNAPANFRLLIGSRKPLSISATESAAKGHLAILNHEDLRLRLEESLEVIKRRLGRKAGANEQVHLHEITQGWPIGLQLAISAIEHQPDMAEAVRSLSTRHGNLQEYLVRSMFSRLREPLASFLVRISVLDHINPGLCEAVAGPCGPLIRQVVDEVPTTVLGEDDSLVLHPLVRDFLHDRFKQLPQREQIETHARASRWLADHGRFDSAARHAFASGDEPLAHACVARSLWALGTQGRLAEARELVERIPSLILAADTRLRLEAAWLDALGERNEAAMGVARGVAEDPETVPQLRMTALRVAGGAAAYSDRVGLLPGIIEAWPDAPDQADDPLYKAAPLNAQALVALHAGASGHVRELLARWSALGSSGSLRLAAALGRAMSCLSHLWDGNACLAEEGLEEALAQAEREEGRRGMISCILAAVLTAVQTERDRPQAALMLMANRLDVVERSGFPDTILAAYRALARIAMRQGDDRRALNLLSSLHAIGKGRNMPRLCMHSLADRIRIHAMRARIETAAKLACALDELSPRFQSREFQPFLAQHQLASRMSQAYIALARKDPDASRLQLEAAAAIADRLNCGREALTIKALRAVVSRQLESADALPLLAEALGLADIGGIARLAEDTHPLAARMARELRHPDGPEGAGAPSLPASANRGATATPTPASSGHGLLTAKEANVLQLLAQGLHNKLIANHMSISDETVKWHLKNIFGKLSAGNRRHAIDRARLLGLVRH